MLFGHGLIDLPGDTAVAEVARDAGAQFGDVEGFSEVHFEHGAPTRSQGYTVRGCFSRFGDTAVANPVIAGVGGLHRIGEGGFEAGFGQPRLARADRLFVTMDVGVGLQELNASAVTVHVAEAADVHEDVETETMTSAEGAEEFVVATAVLGPQRDEFGELSGVQGSDVAAKLPVRVVTVRIEDGSG